MDRFLCSNLPAAPSSPSPSRVMHHSIASKQLAAAQASAGPSSASLLLPEATAITGIHKYPDGDDVVQGARFEVDFNHVYRHNGKLVPVRFGYAIRHKSYLKGGRELAAIWQHGMELLYLEDDGKKSKYWLCQICHLASKVGDARKLNITFHIHKHMRVVHRINPGTGLMPETPQQTPFL
jgi:hypothetical protein